MGLELLDGVGVGSALLDGTGVGLTLIDGVDVGFTLLDGTGVGVGLTLLDGLGVGLTLLDGVGVGFLLEVTDFLLLVFGGFGVGVGLTGVNLLFDERLVGFPGYTGLGVCVGTAPVSHETLYDGLPKLSSLVGGGCGTGMPG